MIATSDETTEEDFDKVLFKTINRLRDDLKKTPHDDDLTSPFREPTRMASRPPVPPPTRLPSLDMPSSHDLQGVQAAAAADTRYRLVGEDVLQMHRGGRDMRTIAAEAVKMGRSFIF
jgi:hypothetical protein